VAFGDRPAATARKRKEAAMTAGNCQPVSVSRRIQAPAEELFEVLADPARHPGIDGSGMLRQAMDSSPVRAVGDTFTISMHNAEMGDYEITSHVVEYQPSRRIGWEPVLTAASRADDAAGIGDRNGHRWIYELTPAGPGATIVTEKYDCSRAPATPSATAIAGDGPFAVRLAWATASISRARSSCLACRSHFGMLRSLS
jgi:hypothetical protein